jgi:paraquat-inducible protein A
MWVGGEPIVGALIGFCAVIAPGAFLLFMVILLLAARRTPPPPWVAEMLRWTHHFEMWSMLEVMMLGIMVALIKIAEVASVEAGIGMYAVFALMVFIPSILVTFDARELWNRVSWVDGTPAPGPPQGVPMAEPPR